MPHSVPASVPVADAQERPALFGGIVGIEVVD
jgi:hypothetical protein